MHCSYIQYNNTLVPGNVSTVYNHSATSRLYGEWEDDGLFSLPGVPNNLANGVNAQEYGGTSVLRGTTIAVDSTLTVSVRI